MRRSRNATTIAAALAMLGLAGSGGAAEPDPLGHVTSLHGDVIAESADGATRPLGCGDRVFAGERLVTGPSSRVGVLFGDVHAQLTEESSLQVGRTPAETSAIRLDAGGVRVIDPRGDGEGATLAALDAQARVLGNDAEAYVFAEKAGRYAMLCEYDAPLPVARGGERATADPGSCVISKQREPLYTARAHDQRLGSLPGDACAPGPIARAVDDRFTPDVAAPGLPVATRPDLPTSPDLPPRSPCDEPGSNCVRIASELPMEPPIVVIEPPPGGGDFPGSGGTFPGNGD
jgi:hypothetical protein